MYYLNFLERVVGSVRGRIFNTYVNKSNESAIENIIIGGLRR